ncbi:MAG TPA: hypothetical protein DD381_05840 [Lentisphaeria bacterium]|nr:MAG: hypothetical protein A2X47_08270 [Lentisphaerae bacterium GWF2_38_69]HBM15846.1 hypothetical protein [Lentisphaeria bacterium]
MEVKLSREKLIGIIEQLQDEKAVRSKASLTFSKHYPNVSESFTKMAAFHSAKSIKGCIDWMTEFNDFLNSPEGGIDFGKLYLAIHHFYNLTVFEKLSNSFSEEVLMWIDTLKSSLEDKNQDHIETCIEELENIIFSTSRTHPEIK